MAYEELAKQYDAGCGNLNIKWCHLLRANKFLDQNTEEFIEERSPSPKVQHNIILKLPFEDDLPIERTWVDYMQPVKD